MHIVSCGGKGLKVNHSLKVKQLETIENHKDAVNRGGMGLAL